MEERRLGNIYGEQFGTGYAGNVWDSEAISPALMTMQGGSRQPMIVAMRGRNPDNPSDRTAGSMTEQRLEPNSQGICNTLTSVQKDNMVLENVVDLYNQRLIKNSCCGTITANGNTSSTHCGTFGIVEKADLKTQYRIRKLTPFECWRLMGFCDSDFLAAKLGSSALGVKTLVKFPELGIEVFADIEENNVLSNSQAYKQAGNSIVKNVLVAILGQLIPGKENVYKDI